MGQKPLNIIQVLRAPTGGLWRHVVDLTMELARQGHRLGLVCDSQFSDPQTEAGLERLAPFLEIGSFRFPIKRSPHPADIKAIMQMRAIAKKHGVDVIHGHGAKGGLLARCATVGNRALSSAYTPHGGVLNFDPRSLKGRLFRWTERAMLPLSDAILFESHYARNAFTAQIGDVGRRGTVVHNGLRPEEFVPLPPGTEYDFIFVGELRAIKGLDHLLRALVSVARPDGTPARLAVAGGGAEADALKRLSAELGLSERVKFFGVQPAREMFAKGRCVVVPSLAESLPYIVLEAVAAGRPVIATRVGGISEIFGPTSEALLPPANSEALRQRMAAFMADPEAFAKEADERRAHVVAGFSVAAMASSILEVYDHIRA